jgi:hypothetical protein
VIIGQPLCLASDIAAPHIQLRAWPLFPSTPRPFIYRQVEPSRAENGHWSYLHSGSNAFAAGVDDARLRVQSKVSPYKYLAAA